jgi:hypothetical protein
VDIQRDGKRPVRCGKEPRLARLGCLLLLGVHGNIRPERGVHDFTGEGFAFYADRRELSSFQVAIPNGSTAIGGVLFMPPGSVPGSWAGQYYFNATQYVTPGTYFTYGIIFGMFCNPHNVTITSIDLP